MKKQYLLLLILLCFSVHSSAFTFEVDKEKFPGGKQYLFRICLKDKIGTPYSTHRPYEFLSYKALERRRKQGIKIDNTDLPINPQYIKAIEKLGGKVVSKSKWNNTLLVMTKDPAQKVLWKQLECVKDAYRVWTSPDSIPVKAERVVQDIEFTPWESTMKNKYGHAELQINQLNGIKLHDAGFRGKNMTIAVIDGGFANADIIPAFSTTRILAHADMVYPKSKDLFNEQSHGTSVLSCMAVNKPNAYIGTAPEANYVLIRSEYEYSESSAEEDFWCAAAEYADSVGVDLICSSLGYHIFDNDLVVYKYKDLDGKTSQISKAASLLAKKGIIGVVSAGNQGAKNWKKINFLADAFNILTVGAVNKKEINAKFSSIGNTADGRIKPDIMALGEGAQCVSERGFIVSRNGTSFSTPIICGMVACLWQALPQKTALEIIQIVKESGDNFETPDNIYGYGIPNFWKAYTSAVESAGERNN